MARTPTSSTSAATSVVAWQREQALEASRQELEHLARADTLTGLPNRRQFDERLALAVARLDRHGGRVALMYLDVDHFKQMNDAFGHSAGDRVLRSFADRLLGCVRAIDPIPAPRPTRKPSWPRLTRRSTQLRKPAGTPID